MNVVELFIVAAASDYLQSNRKWRWGIVSLAAAVVVCEGFSRSGYDVP